MEGVRKLSGAFSLIIPSQRAYLLTPSHWWLDCKVWILWGHKHWDYSDIPRLAGTGSRMGRDADRASVWKKRSARAQRAHANIKPSNKMAAPHLLRPLSWFSLESARYIQRLFFTLHVASLHSWALIVLVLWAKAEVSPPARGPNASKASIFL